MGHLKGVGVTYMSDESRFKASARPLTSSAHESDVRRRTPNRGEESMTSYLPKTSAQIARHMRTEGHGLTGTAAKAERLRFMGFGNLYNKRNQDSYDIADKGIVSEYQGARDKLKSRAGWKRHFFWTNAARQYKQARNDLRHGHLGAATGSLLGSQQRGAPPQPDEYQGDLNRLVDVGGGYGGEHEPMESEEVGYGNDSVRSGVDDDAGGEDEHEQPPITSEQLRQQENYYDNLW